MEIKTVNALTERPDAEKGWKSRLLNGPRRALRNEGNFGVWGDVRHASIAQDMLVSDKSTTLRE